ncbi:hypothetical protein C0989_012265 [Termitomyces sp. Mn162]|nr:hypothetical protein C0989_012265 [Termitomyces sp. Mn162]
MANILTSTALTSNSKQLDIKNTMIAVMFLLEANILDHISESSADAVASKAPGKLEGLVNKLGSIAKFLAAIDA